MEKRIYFPKERCDPRSFRTETFTKETGETVRLIYCCPKGKWNESLGVCEDSMKLHSLTYELGGRDMSCKLILDKGVTTDTCMDFRESRRWVMCRAWDLMDKKEVDSFKEAIGKAWDELRTRCRAPKAPSPKPESRRVVITGEMEFV